MQGPSKMHTFFTQRYQHLKQTEFAKDANIHSPGYSFRRLLVPSLIFLLAISITFNAFLLNRECSGVPYKSDFGPFFPYYLNKTEQVLTLLQLNSSATSPYLLESKATRIPHPTKNGTHNLPIRA